MPPPRRQRTDWFCLSQQKGFIAGFIIIKIHHARARGNGLRARYRIIVRWCSATGASTRAAGHAQCNAISPVAARRLLTPARARAAMPRGKKRWRRWMRGGGYAARLRRAAAQRARAHASVFHHHITIHRPVRPSFLLLPVWSFHRPPPTTTAHLLYRRGREGRKR